MIDLLLLVLNLLAFAVCFFFIGRTYEAASKDKDKE